MKSIQKTLMASAVAMAFTAPAMASFDIDLGDKGTIKFGGYIKMDMRHVNGDIGYTDYWRGADVAMTGTEKDADGNVIRTYNVVGDVSSTNFSVRESRINTTYKRGDVTGFVEMDFYGGGGNELVSNSTSPRLRHAFIGYKNWKVGQTWTNFMPLIALPEAVDFGGPIVGEIFIRQPQVRYTSGNWSFSIENPETWGGSGTISSNGVGGGLSGADTQESMPDFTGVYSTKGDWGAAQVGVLVRNVDDGGIDETATALSLAAKWKLGEDDLRVQVNTGELGRYVGAGVGAEVVTDKNGNLTVDKSTSYTIAYRHVIGNGWRTNIYAGGYDSDESARKRTHVAANLMATVAPGLTAGVEVGRYEISDDGMSDVNGDTINDLNSKYVQFMLKFGL